jgi:phospholipid/cholesterol/gamma-HCH transport system substrate-binding protein
MRTFATYQFFGAAYVAGGVDDVFNDRRTEYFLGIGLRFDDEDLKAILSTTGVPAVP